MAMEADGGLLETGKRMQEDDSGGDDVDEEGTHAKIIKKTGEKHEENKWFGRMEGVERVGKKASERRG